MKRIEYENCEKEYLRTLGFLDENEEFTKSYNKLNDNWKIIRENEDFSFLKLLPEEIKDLLICPYEKLVDYFLELSEVKGSDGKKLKNIFDKNQFNTEINF